MKVLFIWPSKDSFGLCKPIGISILSAIAKRSSWETKLFDTTEIDFGFVDSNKAGEEARMFKPIDFSSYNVNKKNLSLKEEFAKCFNEYNPDCLAFSVLSDEHLIARDIVKIARELNSKIPIIWGGVFPTLNPEKVLREYDVDYVCVGEGLEAFPEFLDSLKQNKDMTRIKNIWVKKDNEIIKNELRPLKRDLDDLPYLDWDLFDKRHFCKPFDGKVYIGADHMTNWGCPYNCSYCINPFYRNKLYNNFYPLRRYTVTRIIEELVFLKERYNLQFLKFQDEDFLLRPLDNFKEFSEEYIKKVNLPFVIMTNSKNVTREKAEILKKMNCVSVSLGVETGNPYIRKYMLRRIDSREDVIRAVKILKEFGIRTVSFNMLGLPFETRHTYNETIDFNKEAEIQYPNIGFFYPFECTDLRDISIQEGFFNPEEETVYRRDKPALKFKNITENQLIWMKNMFNLYIKLPNVYKDFIDRSELQDEIGKKLVVKLMEIYDNTVFKNDGWFVDDGNQEVYLGALRDIIDKKI